MTLLVKLYDCEGCEEGVFHGSWKVVIVEWPEDPRFKKIREYRVCKKCMEKVEKILKGGKRKNSSE